MRELCNKDSGYYENAWELYKAKHLLIVSKSVEEKYNTISSLLFPFHLLSLCVVRV
jgi:phosphoenolpyruvate carboxylase